MPNLEWEVLHVLKSPLGTLSLNAIAPITGYWYQIQPEGYKIVPAMRVTADHVSQQSGSVVHQRYTSGLVATMTVLYTVAPSLVGPAYQPACGADLRKMHEALVKHLEALLDVSASPNVNQRLTWTPTGLGDTRYISAIQTLAWAEPVWHNPGTSVTFSIECPLPYAIDATTVDTPLTAGGPAVLVPNNGSAPIFPLWQVHGATSTFTIKNNDTNEQIVYLGSAIAGGSYAEINTFKGTVALNGGTTDLINGIDIEATDFFTIPPGGANVQVVGGATHGFTNNAYC